MVAGNCVGRSVGRVTAEGAGDPSLEVSPAPTRSIPTRLGHAASRRVARTSSQFDDASGWRVESSARIQRRLPAAGFDFGSGDSMVERVPNALR